MMKGWATPSIVVEDVDSMQVNGLDFQRSLPPSSPPTQRSKPDMLTFRPVPNITICPPTPNSPASSHKSFPGAVIQPEVEAYVTPLSLCGSGMQEYHQDNQPNSFQIQHSPSYHEKALSSPCTGSSKCGKGAGSESSFTSVDIGGAPCRILRGGEESTWNSWNDSDVSAQTETGGCCFEFQSGMNSVVRAVAGCATISSNSSSNNKLVGASHRCVDMSDVIYPVLPLPATAVRYPKKKRMSKCTMIGIGFLILAVAGLIAVGIAMYIEFVTKPLGHQKLPIILNQTAMCDYLINGCEDVTNGTSSLMNLMANRTKATVQNETGKVEATFSSNFKNQLNQLTKNV